MRHRGSRLLWLMTPRAGSSGLLVGNTGRRWALSSPRSLGPVAPSGFARRLPLTARPGRMICWFNFSGLMWLATRIGTRVDPRARRSPDCWRRSGWAGGAAAPVWVPDRCRPPGRTGRARAGDGGVDRRGPCARRRTDRYRRDVARPRDRDATASTAPGPRSGVEVVIGCRSWPAGRSAVLSKAKPVHEREQTPSQKLGWLCWGDGLPASRSAVSESRAARGRRRSRRGIRHLPGY